MAVPDASAASAVAAELCRDGATLIELCGAMTTADAAAVRAAVPEHVAVGQVSFGADSLLTAADHARVAIQGPGPA